mgnify:CR=1 FL=1
MQDRTRNVTFEREMSHKCDKISGPGPSLCDYGRGHVEHKSADHHDHAKQGDRLSFAELTKRRQERANYQEADAYAGKAGHLHLF